MSWGTRAIQACFAFEALYLLVPWQAVFYGGLSHLDFALNQDLVIWMGAPLAYLGARLAGSPRGERLRWSLLLTAQWLWVLFALVVHRDPHGLGPRNTVLLMFIGWVPALNTCVVAARAAARLVRGWPEN